MGKLPEHKKFFMINGEKAESLGDLRVLMMSMKEKDFQHHISGRNDFANWIRDILHKDFLADRLEKVKSRDEMLELIHDEILKDKESELTHSHTFKGLIVKEFVYGLLFGMIIGMLIIVLLK